MVVVNKGNVGDGTIVHKAIVSYTSLVDKALIDNVGETKDMDMLVVDNVVNSNLGDKDNGVSVDDEVLAKHMKLDKGKSTMTQKDHFISKKRKTVSKGNGIVIRENDNPSFDSDTDSQNENDLENQVNPYGNETDMGSETESDESERSFDYLSDCDHEVVEVRKRKFDSKSNIDEGVENASTEHEDFRPPTRNYDIDPFTIVQKSCERFSIYDEETHWKLKKPKLGDKLINAEQFRECLTFYALANGFSLWFYKSCKNKMIAKCGQREEKIKDPSKGKHRSYKKFPSNNADKSICPWRCYGKMLKTENSFRVISLVDTHTCVRNFNYGKLVNYKLLSKNFRDKIRSNPRIRLHEIDELVMKKYKCIVSPTEYRATKAWALNEGANKFQDHYRLLRSYGKALHESNEGSTIKIDVIVNPYAKTYFDRFYIPNFGELLTAVGRDGNNHIFPVAWAVVTIGNKDNWSWFLELLADDLKISNCFGLTLMLDQHKRLIEAVKEVMPLNIGTSKASYPQLFTKIMQKIKLVNPRAHEYLIKKDPKSWSRAFFQEGINCEAVENGFRECFNSVLFEVRRGCDAFKVDERARTCSCRMWQLSGKNWNKNKRGAKSDGTSFVKMRGRKTNRGRLIPVERLGRMKRWLGMDVGTSNLIEELEPLHASYPRNNNNINDAVNVAGTQQSQVVGVHEPRHEANQGTKVKPTKSAIIYRRRTTNATSPNP
nr:pentatricopeptide repeat-containing protein [Tanacetum cinerariifolium]